jgi:hypothetical protein
MFSSIRKCTRTGRPAGNATFIHTLEHLLGRIFTTGKVGRPQKAKKENENPEQSLFLSISEKG